MMEGVSPQHLRRCDNGEECWSIRHIRTRGLNLIFRGPIVTAVGSVGNAAAGPVMWSKADMVTERKKQHGSMLSALLYLS
jgi:hypothetical protein